MTDGYNVDISEEQKSKLMQLFPEVFSEGKIDWPKLKATLGKEVDLGERYGLGWKGKSEVFRVIQEKTVNTLHPAKDESVDWDTTRNLFIEGDNLEALKVLHKAYYGKIKMIYIDPPYNTGNDFIYNDDFRQTKAEYEDEDANSTRLDGLRKNTKDNGRYHSDWLNMMYPRLFLARNLLRDNGVIFVSIDDNEVANLRLIMDEIFGAENFVAQVIWERAYAPVNLKHHFSESHDYILCYARSIDNLGKLSVNRSDEADARYKNPDNDPRGVYKADNFSVGPANPKNIYEIITPSGRKVLPPSGYSWRFSEEKTKELIADNRVYFGENGNNVPAYKRFLSEVKNGMTPMTIWRYKDVGHSQDATKEVKYLFKGKAFFDYPKPVRLIKRMVELATSNDDIILDFFAGSGTTAQAVMELNAEDGGNRKWILVQLPEKTDEKSEARKAGYSTIADVATERIRRARDKITDDFDIIAKRNGIVKQQTSDSGNKTITDIFGSATQELEQNVDFGFRVYEIVDSNFRKWNELVSGEDEIRQQMLDHLDPLESNTTSDDLLTEILLKHGISPLVEIETNDNFHYIPSENLIISLAKTMTQEIFDQILSKTPSRIIFLDQSFKDNLNLKTNLVLQAEQRGINAEVV